MTEDDLVGDIFGWVGTIIATYFYLAPVVPFLKVLRGKMDYIDSPIVLLICSFMNCILWADYGLLNNTFLVYLANGIGGTITLVWITIFLIFLAKKKFIISLLFIIGLAIVVIGLLLFFYFLINKEITGYVAMAFNVLMYAASGEKIYRVFKTKDYALIPIFSTVGGLLCSLCWLIFGIYQNDLNLIIPNGLGLFFAILQVVVYLIYYFKKKNNIYELTENDDIV